MDGTETLLIIRFVVDRLSDAGLIAESSAQEVKRQIIFRNTKAGDEQSMRENRF